jgi:NADH-quinone oxidoreductase subunit M
MIIILLLLIPLLASCVLPFVKEKPGRFALVASLAEFTIACVAVIQFQIDSSIQFEINLSWISSMGINFYIGIDGISLMMVLLTAFLTPLIILSALNREYKNPSVFYSLIMLMQLGLMGVFVSLNALLFYIFWELALIPIYFIVAFWGGKNSIAATWKFFIYTIFGSFFMLIAFIWLYFQTPDAHSFSWQALTSLNLGRSSQALLFWAFFIAFAIKLPIFPFHTWQPATYTEAPTPGTMLLAGIMLKMGIYGIIRWMIPVIPLGLQDFGKSAILLSVIGIIYASIIAIKQKDFKRLIAFSSIAHVGLIAAGIFAFSQQSLEGSIIQMLSHGINAVGLFFIADIIFSRTKTNSIASLGGIINSAPQLAIFFSLIMFGTIALPLTNGFWGEFLLLMGVYQYNAYLGVLSGSTIIFGAVYMLRAYQKIMLGESNALTKNIADLTLNEKAVLIPIVFMVIWMGVNPEFFMKFARPAIENIMSIAGSNGMIGVK